MAKKKDKSDKKESTVIDAQSGKKKKKPEKKPEKKSSITKKAEKLVRSKKTAVSPEVAILEAAVAILSPESISLRAYFIGEQRVREGREGDHHGDWHEAERQLQEEHKKKKKR